MLLLLLLPKSPPLGFVSRFLDADGAEGVTVEVERVDAVAYVLVEEVVILDEVAALTLTVPESGGVLLAVVAGAETVEPLSCCRGVLWRVLVAIGGGKEEDYKANLAQRSRCGWR